MGIRSLVTLHPRAAAPAVLALLVLFQPHRHSSSSSSTSSASSSSSLFVSFLLRSGSLSSLALVLAPARASASFASLRLSSLTTPLSARSRPWSLPAARTLYSLPPRPRGNAPPKNIDPVSTTRFMFCGRADPYLILASCAFPSLSSSSCSSTSISSSSYAARNKPTSMRTLSLAAIVEASR